MFEALHCETNHVNDYAILLSLLVSSPKDAELLIQNGILENTESVATSTFCGEIGKQARGLYNRFYYKGLTIDLNAYCKSPWRKWNANLKQTYFNSPWASISVIAAVVLLLLTITQTNKIEILLLCYKMDKSDDACIDIKSLATCLRGKLENLYPLSEDCCIYRVPPESRNLVGSLGIPQTVSIGPLHHGREELKALEQHKLRYSKQFLQRTQVSLEDFLICIKSKEEKLRNCYAETIPLASQDFVEMILLDAIFLIEFLLLFSNREFVTNGDLIFGKPLLFIGIALDIWSVENQIPFSILEDLFELAKTRDPVECYDGLSISKLVSPFCDNICELLSITQSLIEINFSGAKHFVDLLRLCIEPLDHQLDIDTETIYTPTLPTITELHQAGAKFEVGSNKHLFDITFDKIKGILEIPKLRISKVSFYYFKNLQMFEELHCGTNYVNDYAHVLSLLVSSPKDAELLIQNGILENTESVAASTFCGEIGKQARVSFNKFYYKSLAIDLNAYCKSPWRKWNANLKQNYFNSPWASISVIAAVLLLLLTITQTNFLIFIKSKEETLRNCYMETIPLASQDFVQMILLDAIYLIEFLFLFSTSKFVTSGDPIFGKPWLIIGIREDIWSVENQIPFFIIEELFELPNTGEHDEFYDGLSISKL
ncbi:hypothetical protein Ddye_028420, partial [Dipteronia dyeriana]